MNLRLSSAMPERAAPSSMTVVPPSGTELKERRSVKVVMPLAGGLATWNVPLNAVVSKPIALTVPAKMTFKKPPIFEKTLEEERLNVKVGATPTDQKLAIAPELKFQGEAIVTGWPPAEPSEPMNVPEVEFGVTTVPNQATAVVAVATLPLFN